MDSEESFALVDVRDGFQYRAKHLPGAISLPLNTGDEQIAGFLALPKDELIFIY
jgi:rhodanese-related sulfurtransferase